MRHLFKGAAISLALLSAPHTASARQSSVPAYAVRPDGTTVDIQPGYQVGPDGAYLPPGTLPVSGVNPLTQAFTATGNSAAWTPVAGRPINVTITGTATGLSVRLARSFDNGSTWSPLTVAGQPWAVWTGIVSEQAWVETEAPAVPIRYRAEVTAIASGTATIRLSQ